MPEEIRAGHRTFWRVMGAGPRPALAIHCALAHSGAWTGVMARLDSRITLTAFDLPGHGKSADWDRKADYPALCRAIAETFVDEPLDLIGHSFGAVTALAVAQAHPEAIRTLTLIEPVLFAAVAGTPEGEEHRRLMAGFTVAMTEGRFQDGAEAFTAVWGTGADWAGLTADSRRAVADRIDLIPAGNPALEDDCFGILRPDALESLEMPVLLIRGDRSPPIVEAIAETLAARIADVGVATVPGAGHMLPITHPREVAGLIAVNLDRA